jgi:hypothetical protein
MGATKHLTLLLASTSFVLVSCSSNDSMSPSGSQLDNLHSSAGDFALDYLTAATYDEIVVEIDWIAGHPPSSSARSGLEATLAELCNKPSGVRTIVDDEIPSAGSPTWTYDAIEDLELEYRDEYRDPASGTCVMYCLYLDGRSQDDSGPAKVLGVAYRGSSLAMFHETIEATDPGLPLFAEIEDTVLLHEAGHLLGLVDNGISMVQDHRDPAHGAHDSSDECLMYWALETQDAVDVLLARRPDFGPECRADMIAAGGRVP